MVFNSISFRIGSRNVAVLSSGVRQNPTWGELQKLQRNQLPHNDIDSPLTGKHLAGGTWHS